MGMVLKERVVLCCVVSELDMIRGILQGLHAVGIDTLDHAASTTSVRMFFYLLIYILYN
jgi:hypothetical protein